MVSTDCKTSLLLSDKKLIQPKIPILIKLSVMSAIWFDLVLDKK